MPNQQLFLGLTSSSCRNSSPYTILIGICILLRRLASHRGYFIRSVCNEKQFELSLLCVCYIMYLPQGYFILILQGFLIITPSMYIFAIKFSIVYIWGSQLISCKAQIALTKMEMGQILRRGLLKKFEKKGVILCGPSQKWSVWDNAKFSVTDIHKIAFLPPNLIYFTIKLLKCTNVQSAPKVYVYV